MTKLAHPNNFVSVHCDYNHVPYRVRQKMSSINSYLLEASQYSHLEYRLALFDDGCILYETLKNQCLWSGNYFPVVVLLTHLKNLVKLWYYENQKNSLRIQKNEHLQLLKTYGN